MTTGEIVMCFPDLSRFAVMQHIKVLARANLIITRKDAGEDGRERHHFLNVVPIQQIYERWVRNYEALWAGMLTGLKAGAELAGDSPTARGQAPRTQLDDGRRLVDKASDLHDLRRERRAGRGGGGRA